MYDHLVNFYVLLEKHQKQFGTKFQREVSLFFGDTRIFFYSMSLVVVARFWFGGVAIRYVLPVLLMTSRVHVMAENRR